MAAAVTLPAPAAGQQGTFWAIFSHFGSPSAVRSTVTAAPQISAQSPCFAVHISSPHAVHPFPLGGGDTTATATTAGEQPFCLPSAPFWMRPQPARRPPPRGWKTPTLLKPGSQSILVLRLTGCKTAAVHHTMHTMRNVYYIDFFCFISFKKKKKRQKEVKHTALWHAPQYENSQAFS